MTAQQGLAPGWSSPSASLCHCGMQSRPLLPMTPWGTVSESVSRTEQCLVLLDASGVMAGGLPPWLNARNGMSYCHKTTLLPAGHRPGLSADTWPPPGAPLAGRWAVD